MMRRSGSLVEDAVVVSAGVSGGLGKWEGFELEGEEGEMEVVAESSALMRSWVISRGWILWDCDISAKVRVRSTRVSRPSVEERRRTLMFFRREVGEMVPLLAVAGKEGELGGE